MSRPRPARDEFIAASIAMHGDVYDYSQVVYRSRRSKVVIICKKHGEFDQTAQCHVRGNGCPKCQRKREDLPGIQAARAAELAFDRFATLPRPVHPIDRLLREYRQGGAQ